MRITDLVFALVILQFAAALAAAHGPLKHSGKPEAAAQVVPRAVPKFATIDAGYQVAVKAIFSRKCLGCHGGEPARPWYYMVPGVKQLMDYDVTEGREHLDLSKGFPFGGHGNPKDDLRAIREVVERGTMPPLRYRVMHWSSALTADESGAIIRWVDEAEALLLR